MEKSGIVLNYVKFFRYLRQTKHEAPGVNPTFAGPRIQDDIDNVIAYVSPFGSDGGQDRKRFFER